MRTPKAVHIIYVHWFYSPFVVTADIISGRALPHYYLISNAGRTINHAELLPALGARHKPRSVSHAIAIQWDFRITGIVCSKNTAPSVKANVTVKEFVFIRRKFPLCWLQWHSYSGQRSRPFSMRVLFERMREFVSSQVKCISYLA